MDVLKLILQVINSGHLKVEGMVFRQFLAIWNSVILLRWSIYMHVYIYIYSTFTTSNACTSSHTHTQTWKAGLWTSSGILNVFLSDVMSGSCEFCDVVVLVHNDSTLKSPHLITIPRSWRYCSGERVKVETLQWE